MDFIVRRWTFIAGPVALLAVFAAAWGITTMVNRGDGGGHRVTAAPSAARTSLPGLKPAASEPGLPSLATLEPRPGAAVQAAGPFDDRFTLSALRFDGKAVHGTATITSDVSDILEFEALAGFYSSTGQLVGTGRFTYHLDEGRDHPADNADGTPSELESFSIQVPASLRGKAVSAAVGVPVLVNE